MRHCYCSQCGYETSLKTELKKHMRTFHTELMSNCVKCDKNTKQSFGVQHHINSIHDGKSQDCLYY